MIKKFNVKKTKQLGKINMVLSWFYRKPKAKTICDLDHVKSILIIDFALIGDMVMNIPFLKSIRRNCPSARITMVCMPWAEAVLGDQKLVDEFIVFDGKNKLSSPMQIIKNIRDIRTILKMINTKSYEIGIEPKGDLRHILFLHYTNCNRTISYNYTGGDYLITDSFTPKQATKHLIDEKLDLLELAGFKIYDEDRIPRLKLSADSQQIINNFFASNDLLNKKILGIHPGASNTNKQYPFYAELIKGIETFINSDHVYAVFEGPGEKAIVDNIIKEIKELNANYIRIKRKIHDYIALVSLCDYMICNDSAAGHIAAAYGIPTMVIFGPTKPETGIPKSVSSVKFVSIDLPCKPCTLPICPLKTNECIRGIDVKTIINIIKSDLNNL